ncbi:lef1 [Lambdina fiscellaria nucleopolyhedrovirus]|uniref:Lef1 n=1 Tax=Lambdina fiscellaria nucleopolyhedrovirus TaxID=1642929 RepID=A0A0E3Z5X9_9ABAC|nr:lef1 [Lambdina fiscellaria nucleopolyhedrovirus]AKC91632.1 lef1 [Lambdina fiscellaria nucleopolyhedrovirus]
MLKIIKPRYNEEQARAMWNSVAYNDARCFAFFDGQRWFHPLRAFSTFEKFNLYLRKNKISDVHVKPLPNKGGREWVVDVDFKDGNADRLQLKIEIAHCAFLNFFGESVCRIMHTGNRGVHVWLRIDRFRMNADKSARERYLRIFQKPKNIVLNKATKGSFVYCLCTALTRTDIKTRIIQLSNNAIEKSVKRPAHNFESNKSNNGARQIDIDDRVVDADDMTPTINGNFDYRDHDCVWLIAVLNEYWPTVDSHVFCNQTQIRVPFSYNFKGKRFSFQL